MSLNNRFSVIHAPKHDWDFLDVPVIKRDCSLMKSNIWKGVAPSEASNKGVGNGTCVYHTHARARTHAGFYPYSHTLAHVSASTPAARRAGVGNAFIPA